MSHVTGQNALDQIKWSSRLFDDACAHIRDAITSGRLPPGARLSIPVLAQQLGISRSPTREALIRLAKEGLVQLTPRRGAIVARFTDDELQHLYWVREALEGLATRLAAELIDSDSLQRLSGILDAHRGAVAQLDLERHLSLDLEFHSAIRSITKNARLIEFIDQLQEQIKLAVRITSAVPGRVQAALADHEQIYARIAAHDPDGAETAMKAHIRRLRLALME